MTRGNAISRGWWLGLVLASISACGSEATVEGDHETAGATSAHPKAKIDVDGLGCRMHADCESQVCDTFAQGGLGACVKPSRVLHVSSKCTSEIGSGTPSDPFCRIGDAVSVAATSEHDVVRVMPGTYTQFFVSGQSLRIFGPAGEGGVARVFEEDSGAARVGHRSDVLLDGFELGGPTHSGLICAGSRVVVRRSTLRSDIGGGALRATGCDLMLDRVAIRTYMQAVALTDTQFSIVNTFAGESNERPTLVLRNSSGEIRFSTLAALQEFPSGTVDCGDARVLIRDSIVAGNGVFPQSGSRFSGRCQLDRVVVGDDPITGQGTIHLTPVLEDGYRLPLIRPNFACCIDQAGPDKPPRWDIDGTARPQGKRSDLGAFEALPSP